MGGAGRPRSASEVACQEVTSPDHKAWADPLLTEGPAAPAQCPQITCRGRHQLGHCGHCKPLEGWARA